MISSDVGNAKDTSDFVSLSRQVAKYYEAEPRTQARVEVAGKTHAGLVRKNNEDQFLAVRRYRGRQIITSSLPEELLVAHEDHAYTLAVADGMGGEKFGDLASLLAMRTGWELGADEIKWTVRLNDREVDDLRRKADVFCKLVDESLHAEVRDNPKLFGMGTTLTICYTTGPNLFTIHVGDSRAYLHRNASLKRLTRDHNLGQVLVDSGEAEPDSPEVLRMRHVLTNCIGGPTSGVKAEFNHYMLKDGDRVLLCSDGLNDMAPDESIAAALNQHPTPAAACDALIKLALDGGGKDNVTVIVADYHFEEPKE
jgi:PPM family protein phosphatase